MLRHTIIFLHFFLLAHNSGAYETDPDLDLSVSIYNGEIEAVKNAIERGALLNGKENSGISPLASAASGGHTEIVRLLLHKGANPNKKDAIGNVLASLLLEPKKNEEMISLIIEESQKRFDGTSEQGDFNNAFISISENLSLDTLKSYMKKTDNIDVNFTPITGPVLFRTLQAKNYEVFEYLLSIPEIDHNQIGLTKTSLEWAISNKDLTAVRMLLKYSDKLNLNTPNKLSETPLDMVIRINDKDLTITFLTYAKGLDLNRKNIFGESVFESVDDDEILQLLLNYKP